MRSFSGILIAAVLLLTTQTFAYEPKEGNVSAALGPFLYKTNFEGGVDRAQSPYLADFGLLVQGDTSDKGNLEISLFHMNKMFFRDQGGDFLAEQVELMQIGLGYRWWLNPYLSFAAAFYSSYVVSDPKTVHFTQASSNAIDTSARDITEYGFDFSLQTELWSQDRLALILDARYARSVTSKENESSDHYGALLAVRYFIQSKVRK